MSNEPKPPPEAHIDPPAYGDSAPLNDYFQRPYAPRLDGTSRYRERKFKSNLENVYNSFYIYGILRWLVDLAALIISIVILASKPAGLLVTASAYTVAVVCYKSLLQLTLLILIQITFSLPLFGPRPRPRGETDARPPSWMTPYLGLSRLLMIGSIVLMFLCYNKKSQDDHEESIYMRGLLRRYVDVDAPQAYWQAFGVGCTGLVST